MKPVTKQDRPGGGNMTPRPVSRPPVDPSTQRAFGRPDGVSGAFLGPDHDRDQGDYTPTNQSPEAVLAEAFGPGLAAGSEVDAPEQPGYPMADPAPVLALTAAAAAPPPLRRASSACSTSCSAAS